MKDGEILTAEWLLKKDEPIDTRDTEQFLNRSIFGILGMLSRIRKLGSYSNKTIYTLNATLKVIFTILNIILLSLSRSFLFIIIYFLYIGFSLIFVESQHRKSILAISLTLPVLTFVMLLPSFINGNINNSILIIMKVFGSILSANILSYTTKWNYITKSLKLFLVPDIFIWVMDITIKYIVILGEHSVNLLYALKLRSIGKNHGKHTSITSIMGNLFLKSKDMGEEMFSAMECRGFTGEYKSISKFKIDKADIFYSAANILVLILFITLK